MSQCVCIDVAEPYYDHEELWIRSDGTDKCCECGCKIPKGEKYQHHSCFTEEEDWENQKGYTPPDVYKTCAVCARIRDDYFECGWHYGMMWEDLEEYLEADESCSDYRIDRL